MPQRINQAWHLAARPKGEIRDGDFEFREEPVPELEEGQVLVRNRLLSLDPANRGWMNDQDTYLPKLALGEVMRGIAIGEVEESSSSRFQPGDLVQGLLGWQRYYRGPAGALTKLPPIPLPVEAWFGLLGHIGLTAYFGLIDIGQPKPGETLVVSAAAGAVGSLACQIGKIHGLRVVGIAGSDEKCAWLTGELGVDAAVNYRKANVAAALRAHCPSGIDIVFENVGGDILDASLAHINLHARIVLCGMISMYNAAAPPPGPRLLFRMIMKRARMEGFIVLDYLNRAQEAIEKLIAWRLAGKLRYRIDAVDGLENAPAALRKLFDGSNTGKLVVRI
jgi:hypothetical protein